MLIKGFDKAVIGMEKGGEKEIKLSPDRAYGELKDDMIREFPKEQINIGQDAKEGMILGLSLTNGQQLPAKVVKVTNDAITLDLNHPLAGKTLIFKIKVIDVTPFS